MHKSSSSPSETSTTRDTDRRLRIAYLFMRYPAASQPFAISDVKSLSALGHQVDPYALSGWDRKHTSLVRGYDVTLVRGSHISWRTFTEPLRPSNWPKVFRLLSFLARHHRDWRSAARAILLAPRIVEIAAELERTKPDVVHAFWGHYPSLVIPLVARSQPDCLTSMFLGAYDLTSHLGPYSVPAADHCRTVWTHSEENRPALLGLGIEPRKLRVGHRGIPLDLARGPMPAREPFRICTAANLQKEKNVDLVLKVFRTLLERIPLATLTVAGDGEEWDALRSLAIDLGIDQRVEFTGHLRRDELFREMARARVFLFLSTKVSERLPNVVKEAMLAECHCVVSETPGIRELIHPGRTGEIVKSLDPEAIAARVGEIMQAGTTDVGREAARFVRKHMSSDAAMRRYVDAWRDERKRTSGMSS